MRLGEPTLKVLAIIFFGSCWSLADAQVPITVGSDYVSVLKDNNFIHGELKNPLLPPQSDGLPAKDGTQFMDLGQTNDFQYRHANSLRQVGNVLYLEGECLFLVRGYRVSCDSVQYDKIANTATLTGHVHVDGDLFAITDADSVSINFAKNTYVAKSGTAQVSPQLIQGGLTDKAYIRGRESFGDERMITTLDGSVTTCNLPVPHYDIEARNTVLYPGRRVIFRKTKIRILGYVVAELPFLSLPLDSRSSKYVPYVGQSVDEGYFAKWLIDVPTKNPHYNLETHEDFMTKLGVGLGVDYSYQNLLSAGTLSIYHIFGSSDDLVLAVNHKQHFGWGTLSIQSNYQKDNYLVAPNSTTFNNKITALIPQGLRGSDTLTFTDSETSSLGYTTSTNSLALDDRRNYGNKLTSTADLTYFSTGSTYASGTSSTSNQESQRLDVNLQVQQDFNAVTGALQYQKSFPIGQSSTYIGGQSETPVVSLSTDSKKLLGNILGGSFPFKTLVSWGDFQDPKNVPITREFFDFSFNKIDTAKTPFKVDMNGEFKQGIYSDNTAEYVLSYGTNLRYDLGQSTGVNLRWNYLRPYGYSPLSIDQTGQSNFISGDVNVRPIKPLLLGAQTGYDLLRLQQKEIPWQQIGLRTEYTPQKWFMFRGLFTYDTYAQKWQNLQFDLTYLPGATRFTMSATYDGEQHVWSSINLNLQNFVWGKLKSSTVLAYNGFLNRFDSEQFNFVYDLHCAEAVFELQQNNSGFRAGRQIAFFLRLKALPYDVPFGVGTRGQPIGFNNGSSF